MIETGAQILLRLSDPAHHQVLHLGGVVDVRGNVYTAEFEIAEFVAEVGQNVIIYFHTDAGFLQQPARVDEVDEGSPIPRLSVTTTGDPVSAESRQQPRVSTVASELIATVGGEEFCPILDLSPAGFAVMASELYTIGSVVEICVQFGERRFTGAACVQSVKELWEGRYRYGLYCLDDDEACDLKQGLLEISAEVTPTVE